MAIKLFIQKEGEEARELDFEGPVVSIGRGEDNDLVVDDARSSRKHCSVSETPQGAVLEDLGSSNGTRYKGEPVTKSLLEQGDKFLIGATTFFFGKLPEKAAPSSPAPSVAAGADSAADLLDEIEQAEAAASDPGMEPGEELLLEEPGEELLLEEPGEEPGEDLILEEPEPEPAGQPGAAAAAPEVSPAKVQEESAAPAVKGALVSLSQVVGELENPEVNVESLPFSIGRSSSCDLTLNDQRASGRHAELVSKDGLLAILDLDSKNGVLVDDHKVKQAGVLGDGSSISVGSHMFNVKILDDSLRDKSTEKARSQQARREELMPRGEPAGAMKLSVDIDSVTQGDSIGQLVSVAALVAVVVFVAFFCVQIANDLLTPEEIDKNRKSNKVSNWSFEKTAPEEGAQSVVFNWTGRDNVQIKRVSGKGTIGGFHSLGLSARGASPTGIYSAVNDEKISVSPGDQYLVEGYVTREGGFLAGLMVEWLDDGGKLLGRSFSVPQNSAGNTSAATQVVTAPGEDVSVARVSCFIMGQGSAWFDQVFFASVNPEASPAEGEDSEGEKVASGNSGSVKTWEWSEPEPGQIRMQRQAPGVFSPWRGNRSIMPSFWAGIDAGRDRNLIGPGLTYSAPPREADDGSLEIATRVIDLSEEKWIAVQNVVNSDASSISLNWQLELQGEKTDQERALVLYFDFDSRHLDRKMVAHGPRAAAEFSLGDASGGPFDELVMGDDQYRTSMEFTRTVNVSTLKHPVFSDRWLLVIVPADKASELGVSFSHGSRREAQAAKMKLAEAERLFGAGDASEAISLLEKLPELYPLQEAEISRSKSRIAQWRADAAKVVNDLDVGLGAYRRNPSEVIYRSLRSRGSLLSERYAGTSAGDSVGSKIATLDSIRATAASGRAVKEQEELLAAAGRFKDDEQYGVASLYIQMVLALAEKGSQVHQDAINLGKLINTRTKAENEVKLGQ